MKLIHYINFVVACSFAIAANHAFADAKRPQIMKIFNCTGEPISYKGINYEYKDYYGLHSGKAHGTINSWVDPSLECPSVRIVHKTGRKNGEMEGVISGAFSSIKVVQSDREPCVTGSAENPSGVSVCYRGLDEPYKIKNRCGSEFGDACNLGQDSLAFNYGSTAKTPTYACTYGDSSYYQAFVVKTKIYVPQDLQKKQNSHNTYRECDISIYRLD